MLVRRAIHVPLCRPLRTVIFSCFRRRDVTARFSDHCALRVAKGPRSNLHLIAREGPGG